MVKLARAGEALFHISRELNGRGLGFRGGMWTGDTVLNMLHNRGCYESFYKVL